MKPQQPDDEDLIQQSKNSMAKFKALVDSP